MAPAVIQIASAISQRLGYHGPMDGDERRGLVDAAEHELAAGRQQQLGGADERRTP
jgi:hypothetical protein